MRHKDNLCEDLRGGVEILPCFAGLYSLDYDGINDGLSILVRD